MVVDEKRTAGAHSSTGRSFSAAVQSLRTGRRLRTARVRTREALGLRDHEILIDALARIAGDGAWRHVDRKRAQLAEAAHIHPPVTGERERVATLQQQLGDELIVRAAGREA